MLNLCVRSPIRSSILNSLLRFSSTTEALETNDQVLIPDTDEIEAREAEIEEKRNKSRLSKPHFNTLHGRRPYDEPFIPAHKTVKYNRKLYGKYGIVSGINPSICWPSKQDIEEKLEYESVAYPYTITQMIEMAKEKRAQEELQIQLREKDLAAKFAKLIQWKKELHDKIKKKTDEAAAAKEKKERLVEDVRRHFGFKLDPRDERFQEMLAKREKEQKKVEKLAKREAKEKMLIAKLQQKSADIEKA